MTKGKAQNDKVRVCRIESFVTLSFFIISTHFVILTPFNHTPPLFFVKLNLPLVILSISEESSKESLRDFSRVQE